MKIYLKSINEYVWDSVVCGWYAPTIGNTRTSIPFSLYTFEQIIKYAWRRGAQQDAQFVLEAIFGDSNNEEEECELILVSENQLQNQSNFSILYNNYTLKEKDDAFEKSTFNH